MKIIHKSKTLKLEDIIFNTKYMFRSELDRYAIKRYAEAMATGSTFPKIVVNEKNEIICGFLRYKA